MEEITKVNKKRKRKRRIKGGNWIKLEVRIDARKINK